MGFQQLFNPNGVAVFGSVAPGKIGNQLITQLKTAGNEKIFAINPKAHSLDDIKGYASILDVTENVDLAVIAAPAGTVAGIMEECGQKGVKAAILISSGFSEAGNHQGEQEVLEIAQKYNIRFTGPNCAGVVNTHGNLAATVEVYPISGYTSIISQSGAVGGILMGWSAQQKLGISKFVSYGNGADLNQIEFLHYLKDDPDTKVIALYIESIVNGREFIEALKEVTAVKPVVVIKSGKTSTGQRAALSHTGSMAGSDAVYDAVLKSCGAIRVKTVEDLVDTCKAFATLPKLQGDKIAIITNSGGPGVMTADRGEEMGLNICEPDAATITKLKELLPPHAGFGNPIDMTLEGTPENYNKVTATMLETYDAAIEIFVGTPFIDTMEVAKGILAAKHPDKPIIPVLQSGADIAAATDFLYANSMASFMSAERAVKVLAAMSSYNRYLQSLKKMKYPKPESKKGELFTNGPLLEPECMELLAKNKIPTAKNAFITSRGQVAATCDAFGYPLVMKVVSPEILHKTDFGGVELNIKSASEAVVAFDRIALKAKNHNFKGVIIYPMLQGGKELILGLTTDRQFGPVIAFGLGGIYTEVLKDIAFAVAPVNRVQAMELINSIRTKPILHGVRGEKPLDLSALADTIVNFSQLPFRYPDLVEADINPLFAFEKGVMTGDIRLVGKKQ